MSTETTQSATEKLPKRSPAPLQAGAGIVLSLGAFAFGAFMALPAALVVIPKLRRYWPLALALFVGSLGVRGLSLLGVNPVLVFARDRAVSQLSESLGGEVSYDAFHGDAVSGELHFDGLKVDIPEIGGEVSLESVSIDAGTFLIYRPGGYIVQGESLRARVDASGGKLEKFLDEREAPGGTEAELTIEGGQIEVYGSPTTATFDLATVTGASGENGWVLRVGLKHAVLNILDRPCDLAMQGGLSVGDDGSGLRVEADLRATDAEVGSGILRGTLKPGGQSGMVCTLDMIELGPLWARWRKVDTYDGLLRGQVSISGDLNNLAFDFRCEVKDYSYYHYTAMQLDPEHSFKLPEGELAGRIELKDGETWTFKDVSLDAPEATLATGEHMNANGGGKLTLNGVVPELTGKLVATVTDGRIARRISWSPTATQSLNDVEPNIVIVAEQFGKIDLDWEVDVQKLEVDCEPVTGTLSGKLTGTFSKEAGKRVGALRAEGELKLADGRVKCLGIDGELMGSLKFRQTAPTYHAALEGRLTASLGETPVDCEVTGDVKHPVFIFSGAGMSPQDLSRKIFRYSATELTPADQVKRREECTRIFGPAAAVEENPFLAKNAGHVTFNVK